MYSCFLGWHSQINNFWARSCLRLYLPGKLRSRQDLQNISSVRPLPFTSTTTSHQTTYFYSSFLTGLVLLFWPSIVCSWDSKWSKSFIQQDPLGSVPTSSLTSLPTNVPGAGKVGTFCSSSIPGALPPQGSCLLFPLFGALFHPIAPSLYLSLLKNYFRSEEILTIHFKKTTTPSILYPPSLLYFSPKHLA